ncbi:alpha-L-rhamnosidase C-terminal domain-containing protein [Actinomyces sp. 432]|uniref:alpha-L-rhamnosidase C-terminal domain-containing protein n=1 Tax=Actinomyces sp. 432 TaxID=2057798 RepID=UPI00192A504C|nr:alpha-L-rhamnosidase C-terminal domain-containing protein [Actinomyces sp. 432]
MAPAPGGGLTHAESVHRTPYGWAAVAWRLVDEAGHEITSQAAAAGQGRLEVDVVVPVGASARVTLPGREGEEPIELSHGRHHLVA